MFRIRRIYDNTLSIDRDAIADVQTILRQQFPDLIDSEITSLEAKLANPLKYKFKTILFIAENSRRRIKGFAILNNASDLDFCYLDFISVEPRTTGGIGSALYTRAREEARSVGAAGIFLECLPDDPALCRDKNVLRQNRARLRFYERFDVPPMCYNTAYETPLDPDDDCSPYLLFD